MLSVYVSILIWAVTLRNWAQTGYFIAPVDRYSTFFSYYSRHCLRLQLIMTPYFLKTAEEYLAYHAVGTWPVVPGTKAIHWRRKRVIICICWCLAHLRDIPGLPFTLHNSRISMNATDNLLWCIPSKNRTKSARLPINSFLYHQRGRFLHFPLCARLWSLFIKKWADIIGKKHAQDLQVKLYSASVNVTGRILCVHFLPTFSRV